VLERCHSSAYQCLIYVLNTHSTFQPTSRDTNWTCMVGQLKLQYFGAGCWVGRSPNLFFNRNRWREYLSSGEKRAAPQGNILVNHDARAMGTQINKQSKPQMQPWKRTNSTCSVLQITSLFGPTHPQYKCSPQVKYDSFYLSTVYLHLVQWYNRMML